MTVCLAGRRSRDLLQITPDSR